MKPIKHFLINTKKLRILILDKGDYSLGSTRIFSYNLQLWLQQISIETTINDAKNLENYQVIIFGKNTSYHYIKTLKLEYPKKILGLIHPSDLTLNGRKKLKLVNFFIVGSIEEEDYYLNYLKPVFLIPHVELIYNKRKIHNKKSLITIGYHGNKAHLSQFPHSLKKALELLDNKYNIRLNVIYNKKKLGAWKINKPKIEVREFQWEVNTIEEQLLQIDIGLCPGVYATPSCLKRLILASIQGIFFQNTYYKNDYIIGFKNTSNAGRAFVFHQLGIPVVGGFIPSNFHILANPNCGFLAHSTQGWYTALDQLCNSFHLRQSIADTAYDEYHRLYNPLVYVKLMREGIEKLLPQ